MPLETEQPEPDGLCCGNCERWFVLDDQPRDERVWCGCCTREMADELGAVCAPVRALGWAYAHMRAATDAACDGFEDAG